MSSINITLPDKSTKIFPSGISSKDIAENIGPRLAAESVAVKVDSEVKDINTKIYDDTTLEFVTLNSNEGHNILLHSTAHLMAQAVKKLFPNLAKLLFSLFQNIHNKKINFLET